MSTFPGRDCPRRASATDLLVSLAFALPFSLLLIAGPVQGATPGLEKEGLLAQFVPAAYATLAAELPARVESIHVKEGEFFAAGDVLVTLDCDLQEAQRERAQAQLRAAQAAHLGNQRLEQLQAVGAVEVAESAAAVDVAHAELRYLEVTLEKCILVSPWSGAAGIWHVRPLEYVQAGEPLLDILDPASLQVEFIVPTAWLTWFHPGHRFAIHVEELGRDVELTLRGTAARADPVSQSVKAIADIIDADRDLIAGMSGYLRVDTAPGS